MTAFSTSNRMNLAAIIAGLESLDDSLTIVAKRPWNANSEAQLISMTDEGRVPDDALRDGFEYFLEVFIALDDVLGEFAKRLSQAQRVAVVIHYAEHDAYPDWVRTLN